MSWQIGLMAICGAVIVLWLTVEAIERVSARMRYQRNYIHERPASDARSSLLRFKQIIDQRAERRI